MTICRSICALRPGGTTAPELAVVSASAGVPGGGKDTLKLTLHFAGTGTVPATAEDLSIGFGDTFTSPILPAASLVRRGNAWVFSANAPGVTRATVDHAKGTIGIVASGLDLGAFVAGGNDVTVTVTRGGTARTVRVRMVRAGAKLAY